MKNKEKKNKCEYLIWSKRTGELKQCGKIISRADTGPLIVPDIRKIRDLVPRKILYLCDEHKEFVVDCLKGEYHTKHKKYILDTEIQKDLFESNK